MVEESATDEDTDHTDSEESVVSYNTRESAVVIRCFFNKTRQINTCTNLPSFTKTH